MIGECRARRLSTRAVIEVATSLIEADPTALLCDDPICRCGGALNQLLSRRP